MHGFEIIQYSQKVCLFQDRTVWGSFHKILDFSCSHCVKRVIYSAFVRKCTCKHRFGLQLLQLLLWSSTVQDIRLSRKIERWQTKIVTPLCGVFLVFLPMGSEAGIFMRLIMGSAPYFHPVFLSHKGPFIFLCMLSLLVLSVLFPSACIDCPFSPCSCWHFPLPVYLSFFLSFFSFSSCLAFFSQTSFFLASFLNLSFFPVFLSYFRRHFALLSFSLIFLRSVLVIRLPFYVILPKNQST